jgi:hypothetical protein
MEHRKRDKATESVDCSIFDKARFKKLLAANAKKFVRLPNREHKTITDKLIALLTEKK